MKRLLPARVRQRQDGVTLVELMVATVIGLVLLAGITQLYLSSKRSYTALDTLARLQENGRYVVDTLARDLRRAGYWGGNADITAPATAGTEGPYTPPDNSCNTGDTTWGRMVDRRVFGIDGGNALPDGSVGYGACISAADHQAGDILVTRYASPSDVDFTDGTQYDNDEDGNRLYMRSSLFESRIYIGKKDPDSGDPLANGDNSVAKEPNRAALLVANAYYIRNSRNPDNSARQCQGNNIPALWRETLDANGRPAGEELAGGVEQLQVQWGVDTNGNNSVNQYVDASGVADWDEVIAARVWVLMRGECAEPGANDTRTYNMGNVAYTPDDDFRRQLYVTTVMLRNPNF